MIADFTQWKSAFGLDSVELRQTSRVTKSGNPVVIVVDDNGTIVGFADPDLIGQELSAKDLVVIFDDDYETLEGLAEAFKADDGDAIVYVTRKFWSARL